MSQFARPVSDISLGSWNPYPADPTTLFDKIDEVIPNGDTDYIYSSVDEDECEIGLSDVDDPLVGTGHKIRCTAQCPLGSAAPEQMTIALVENGVVRATSPATTVDRDAYVLIEYALSEAEANAIQNYPNLRLRFHITKVNGGEPIQITQAEFECPDAVGEEHSGSGSISGNGLVTGTAKKGGRGSALKSAGGTLLAIGLAGMLAIASVVGGGSQLAVGKKDASVTASVSGGGSVIATGQASEAEEHSGVAVISGSGVIAGEGIKQASGDSDVAGGGLVVAIGQAKEGEEHSGAVAVSGNGIVVGIGIKRTHGDSVVTGGGSVIAIGQAVEAEEHSGAVAVFGGGVLVSTGAKSAIGMVSISGNGDLVISREHIPHLFLVEPRERMIKVRPRERIKEVHPRKRKK